MLPSRRQNIRGPPMSSSSTSEALVRFSSTPSDRRQIPGMSMPNSAGQTLFLDDWTAQCDARGSQHLPGEEASPQSCHTGRLQSLGLISLRCHSCSLVVHSRLKQSACPDHTSPPSRSGQLSLSFRIIIPNSAHSAVTARSSSA